jgi:hypothetical protein
MAFQHPSVFPSRCLLKKSVIKISSKKFLTHEGNQMTIFRPQKYFQKPITILIFMVIKNSPFFKNPKNWHHKNQYFLESMGRITTSGKAKNHFERHLFQSFFYKKCCKIYYLTFIQKISRKINFSFFVTKMLILLPSITIFCIPSSNHKKRYHFFPP